MSRIKFNPLFFSGRCNWRLSVHFFVANVNVDSDGLNVNVNEFSNDNVWNGDYSHRFVIPKLTISPA